MDAAGWLSLLLVSLGSLLSSCHPHPGSGVFDAEAQLAAVGDAESGNTVLAEEHYPQAPSKSDWLIQELRGLQMPAGEAHLPSSPQDRESQSIRTDADYDGRQSSGEAGGRDERPSVGPSVDVSTDQQAEDDLLRLLARIAERPAHWTAVHRTLRTLEHDLQVSRDVIERMKDIEEAVEGMHGGRGNKERRKHRHGGEVWNKKKTRHAQQRKAGWHRRREELHRAGLLASGAVPAPQPTLPGTRPAGVDGSRGPGNPTTDASGNKSTTARPVLAGGKTAVHSLRHKLRMTGYFGAPSAGDTRELLEGDVGSYLDRDVNLRHRGKFETSGNLSHLSNSSHQTRSMMMGFRNTEQMWTDEFGSMTNDHVSRTSPDVKLNETSHVEDNARPQAFQKNRADKWASVSMSSASEQGSSKEETDNSLVPSPRQQQGWSKPTALEAALEKQKALATNTWVVKGVHKPARHFTYHRVTSGPQVQRPRQRSAIVAVSVASAPPGGGRGGGQASGSTPPPALGQLVQERRDPLERQLADLTARTSMPWSHARHLDKIQEQLKSLSAMEQKLQYRWLEKQRLHQMLRDGGKERAISLGSREGDSSPDTKITHSNVTSSSESLQ